jgi:predicted dehydrogenase
MSKPMRIGILGASRIAQESVIDAAQVTGDRKYGIAARDPERAREYAQENGFERVYDDYDSLISDPDIDLVYIGLPNGLHAKWTARALEQNKKVLVEKPFAANLEEFDRVVAALEHSEGWVWEAFHHAHHPIMQRILELASDASDIGELQSIEIHMNMPDPGERDPRWNFDLAGGGVMDLGCYALETVVEIAEKRGAEITVESVRGTPSKYDSRVDAALEAKLNIGGVPAHIESSMVSDDFDFSITLIGDRGEAHMPWFVKPQNDDRVILSVGGSERVEHLGEQLSYTYQLQWIAQRLESGQRDADHLARSRRVMALIDQLYSSAGFPLRPASLTQ